MLSLAVEAIAAKMAGLGASEEDKTPLDAVIAKMQAADNKEKRAQEILAAAITLRD